MLTGDHDDRVVPAHSFKFTAELQHCQGGDAPVLARIETAAGHGLGKPVSVVVAETADLLAFAAEHTGLVPVAERRAHGRRGSEADRERPGWSRTALPFSCALSRSDAWNSTILVRSASSEAARMRTASRPALRALPIGDRRDGTPAGICTIESSESMPSR